MAKRKTVKPDPVEELPTGEDDDLGTTEARSEAEVSGGQRHEHKPAEPTSVMSADEIEAIDPRYARPYLTDAELPENMPGAGDPQNGVAPGDMPEHVSMVAWARPDPSTAQHYPWAEGEQPVGEAGQPLTPEPDDPANVPPPSAPSE